MKKLIVSLTTYTHAQTKIININFIQFLFQLKGDARNFPTRVDSFNDGTKLRLLMYYSCSNEGSSPFTSPLVPPLFKCKRFYKNEHTLSESSSVLKISAEDPVVERHL